MAEYPSPKEQNGEFDQAKSQLLSRLETVFILPLS